MAEEQKPVAMAQHSCALERMHFISGYSPLLFHHGAQGKGVRYMQVPIHPASQGSCSSQNPTVQHSSQVRCYCFCLSNALYNTTGDTLRNHQQIFLYLSYVFLFFFFFFVLKITSPISRKVVFHTSFKSIANSLRQALVTQHAL